jgi:hypothetical protein
MSIYIALLVVLVVTALAVMACLGAAWALAGKSWREEPVICPHCGVHRAGNSGPCPKCGWVA